MFTLSGSFVGNCGHCVQLGQYHYELLDFGGTFNFTLERWNHRPFSVYIVEANRWEVPNNFRQNKIATHVVNDISALNKQ